MTVGSADGTGTAASFNLPTGVAVSSDGMTVYVADYSNHRIRKIDTSDGETTTLAGSVQGFADGTGTAASFSYPAGVAVSPDGRGPSTWRTISTAAFVRRQHDCHPRFRSRS